MVYQKAHTAKQYSFGRKIICYQHDGQDEGVEYQDSICGLVHEVGEQARTENDGTADNTHSPQINNSKCMSVHNRLKDFMENTENAKALSAEHGPGQARHSMNIVRGLRPNQVPREGYVAYCTIMRSNS